MTPSSRRHVHTQTIAMRWGDMDMMGHVNNTVYFRFMEEARVQFFCAHGLNGGGRAAPPDAGPVVINASCSFLRALVYPGDVQVRMYLGEAGRTSVMTWYELLPSYDGSVVYAEGGAKMCYIDKTTRKSIPLPEALRTLAGG